ncbi:MAG TPA: glycosyltransferase [Candidatus Acidoferrales bacterium]|nr:glycosyltransferase [Candidatus Acidoferrales bacterium]
MPFITEEYGGRANPPAVTAKIAAHLILGPREEPFLGALLASIADAVRTLIVNDNGPGESPHQAVLENSAFGSGGRLIVDRTPFDGFAAARNVCMRIHEARNAGDWIAFVDADEVHAPAVTTIANNLERLPNEYDFVDGYTWHFFQSFDYYTSIERRMMFFRHKPGIHWEGSVHERLTGLDGKRIALPYVYAHYGHTLAPRRHAEKGRHYSSLGAPGGVLREDQLEHFDVAEYFAPEYPRLLRFGAAHPPSAITTIEALKPQLREYHALTDRIVRAQPPATAAKNAIRRANYELRWRGRRFSRLASILTETSTSPPGRPASG